VTGHVASALRESLRPSSWPRQQPHRTERAQQQQRIEIHLAAPSSPVQAPPRRPSPVLSRHTCDRLTPRHRLARRDESTHRLVLGANAVRMREHDHAPAGDHAGECDLPGSGGEHLGVQRCLEVDAAMPRGVRRRRRLERPQYPQRSRDRARVRRVGRSSAGGGRTRWPGRGSRSRDGGCRSRGEHQHPGQQQSQRASSASESHAVRLPLRRASNTAPRQAVDNVGCSSTGLDNSRPSRARDTATS
jgi:hypothetical protein